MAPYFTADALQELERQHQDVHRRFTELREKYFLWPFQNDLAREFATHGLGRRLGCLTQAIDIVFETLPPALDEIPDRTAVITATISIQSFVFNTFGCLDNLAWIWVHEKNVTKSDLTPLDPMAVGLGKRSKQVRQSFSEEFCKYLDSRQEWIDNLKSFRDSLAHRIPLYIPPFNIDPKNENAYLELESAKNKALKAGDIAKYEELEKEQMNLAWFRPWMTHSRREKAPVVVFHAQLLQDFLTIDECSRKMLEELAR